MSRPPASSTGDLQNNIEKLRHELLHCKYGGAIDVRALRNGNPADLLPFIHWALLGFSKFVRDYLVHQGHELFTKTDMRFLEAIFKILRQEFDYQPQLRVDQFFVDGFVERKIILVYDILKLCQRKHLELKREAKKQGGDKASSAARPSTARTGASPAWALVRNVGARSSSSAEGPLSDPLQPKIVVDGGGSARVVRVGEDNEECGLPRSGAPPPLPMTTVKPLNSDFGSDSVEDDDLDPTYIASEGFEQIPISQGRAVQTRVSRGLQQQQGSEVSKASLAQLESVCHALQCNVERIVARLESVEQRVELLHGVHAKAESVQEECSARLLLAEGRLRFLEQRVVAMEAEGEPAAHASLSSSGVLSEGQQAAQSKVLVAVVAPKPSHTAAQQPPRPLTAPEQGGGARAGGRAGWEETGAKKEKEGCRAEKKQGGVAGWQEGEEEEGAEKLEAFISGVQERFRQTRQLLDDADYGAARGRAMQAPPAARAVLAVDA